MEYNINIRDARRFLLLKHGLLGDYKYQGNDGVVQFVNDVTCIQYDPVDVCGKNAELVFQSRIKNFKKAMLYQNLYEKRSLIEYFDKNLAIYSVNDWPYFQRIRNRYIAHSRSLEQVNQVTNDILNYMKDHEYVCSKDFDYKVKTDWYWSQTSLSRAALETLYFRGDIVIHHRKGTNRYFSLTTRIIPQDILLTSEPNRQINDYNAWRILRRIKAVGLLWNKPSDAFLCISGVKATERNEAFSQLIIDYKIIKVNIEGIKTPLYITKSDEASLQEVLKNNEYKLRTEFIAPLDNLLWDRKLIKALFNFEYTWEIYTPESKRQYGYYVLPILRGIDFIGRIEIIANRKEKILNINNIWLEEGIKYTKGLEKELVKCLERFKMFNECETIKYKEGYINVRDNC